MNNLNLILVTLEIDAPLFGLSKGNMLLLDKDLIPKAGDIVLIETKNDLVPNRLEIKEERQYLWPLNKFLDDGGVAIRGVVVSTIKELIPGYTLSPEKHLPILSHEKHLPSPSLLRLAFSHVYEHVPADSLEVS